LSNAVLLTGADAGFAFDGDGDRVLCVDEKGGRVSGDKMLAICAKEFKKQGRLANNVVVSTIMSNIGLGQALRAMDVDHVTTQVGDRYVLQEMLRIGARIGSEDSGHMLFLDDHTTGDGIIAALKIAQIMKETASPLSTLADVMKVYPQVLINVPVNKKPDLDTHPVIAKTIERVKHALGDEGRVLTRYSGTQPMCRVMVEGPTREITEKHCREIAEVVRNELG
jgi:phosphoglucosamine mutase